MIIKKGDILYHWYYGPVTVESDLNNEYSIEILEPAGVFTQGDYSTYKIDETKRFLQRDADGWLFKKWEDVRKSKFFDEKAMHNFYRNVKEREKEIAGQIQILRGQIDGLQIKLTTRGMEKATIEKQLNEILTKIEASVNAEMRAVTTEITNQSMKRDKFRETLDEINSGKGDRNPDEYKKQTESVPEIEKGLYILEDGLKDLSNKKSDLQRLLNGELFLSQNLLEQVTLNKIQSLKNRIQEIEIEIKEMTDGVGKLTEEINRKEAFFNR